MYEVSSNTTDIIQQDYLNCNTCHQYFGRDGIMDGKENVFHQIVSNETIAEQAYKALKELLESGDFVPGQKLPSEDEMARQLNISRITLRTALQKLELLGYVDRKRGVGTFVVGLEKKHIDAGIERLVSISEVIRQIGHVHGTK